MTTRSLSFVLGSFALLAAFSGAVACDDDDAETTHDDDHAHDAAVSDAGNIGSSKTQRVEVNFEAKVGTQAFDCGKTYEVGASSSVVKPLDFKLYVHDVRLLDASDHETEVKLRA